MKNILIILSMTFVLSCTSKIDKVQLGREYYGVCKQCTALHPNDTITYTPLRELEDGKYYTEVSYKDKYNKKVVNSRILSSDFFLNSSIKIKENELSK